MPSPHRDLFLLDPSITYLNFGSFGACPKPIFDEYLRYERELESEPVQFIAFNGPAYAKRSRTALSNYIGCEESDLVFTPNPTFAINIIAKNLDLKPGDEVLSTDLEYGAMDRTWRYYCKKAGAIYIRQPVVLPIVSKEKFIDDFRKGFSPRTKVVFLSKITSSTALILPVEEICREARERGIITIIDGAHVPGHIPLNLRNLDADIFTGACHKWMMTPKGSSFLYVRKEHQFKLDPLIVSWGYESNAPSTSQFQDYHQFNGTRDYSAYFTIPKSLEFMDAHDWPAVSAACHEMVIRNAPRFYELLKSSPISPLNNEWIGQMISIPIRSANPAMLQKTLFEDYKIEIPVMEQNGNHYLRYSLNGFNSQEDLDCLYEALERIQF